MVGASRSSGTESYKASSEGSVEAASVQVAAENDLRVADPSGAAEQAFNTFSDAMRDKDWGLASVPVKASTPDTRRETRYLSRNDAEHILDLYCTATSGTQTSCEVRLTTTDSECTD